MSKLFFVEFIHAQIQQLLFKLNFKLVETLNQSNCDEESND